MNYLSFILLFTALSFSQGYQEKIETRLSEIYGDSIEFSFKKIKLPKNVRNDIEKKVRQRFFKPELYSWKMRLGKNIKFAVLDNVLGKVQPITFLTVYNDSYEVEYVEVIKYRESHGYEVRNKTFLTQYNGKSNQSNYALGDGLDGISGATISAQSMSRGVNKLSLMIRYLSEQFK
jgi:Na+-translocating ferredoxin:NAD+ oxidoreductase RnfG subunit